MATDSTDMSTKIIGQNKCFGGTVFKYETCSKVLGNTQAKFCVFIPPQATTSSPVPILYFLSGLTCNEDNFISKSGAAQYAAQQGIALICPDTSPRGIDIEGDSDSWDFGKGAGFYVDANQKPWATNYNMYSFVVTELPSTLKSIDALNTVLDFDRVSVFGHSMGGHGALMVYLRNLDTFRSCSAFAPCCNPTQSRWGQKAFTNFLGDADKAQWAAYDALELAKSLSDAQRAKLSQIKIDQGTADFALTHGDDDHDQLRTKHFEAVCHDKGIAIDVRYREGYGHGYDFIATFVAEHIAFHAQFLRKDVKQFGGDGAVANIDSMISMIENDRDVDEKQSMAVDRVDIDAENQCVPIVKFETEGKEIECLAAVAWKEWDEKEREPLTIEKVIVAAPKAGEVRVKLLCTGVCHTDWYTLSGKDPEGLFPAILGHEGCGIVESIGDGVLSCRPGDVVIPLYIPECKKCKFCLSGKTNLCQAVRATQGKGVMPDETVRFRSAEKNTKDTKLFHFMGTSTFSQYTVLPEISVAVISKDVVARQLQKECCLLGCGVTTGIGAVRNTMKCEAGSTVAVFGLGGVGLSVIQEAASKGCQRIIGVDLNEKKFALAKKLGATDCVNPNSKENAGRKIQDVLIELTGGGLDYTFECIGLPQTMRAALEACHKGWGESCIIGVAASGKEISTRPFNLVVGRVWRGSAFGGTKGRTGVPEMVDEFLAGKININDMITDTVPLSKINEAFWLMKQKEKISIRTVVNLWE